MWPVIAGAALLAAGSATGVMSGKNASKAQKRAAQNAAEELRNSKAEAISYLQPYSQVGREALSPLTSLLLGKQYNASTGQFTSLTEDQRMSNFLQSPGYQFRLTQGLSAIEKSQIARGGNLSGGALKEITDYSQGVASDEYNNYLNSLFQAVGMGQAADTAKGNYALGAGADLSSLTYAGGMGDVNRYNNLANFGFGLAGIGAAAMMSGKGGAGGAAAGGASAAASQGGRYNSSYMTNSGMNSMGQQ